jgi:hypothetical protein
LLKRGLLNKSYKNFVPAELWENKGVKPGAKRIFFPSVDFFALGKKMDWHRFLRGGFC